VIVVLVRSSSFREMALHTARVRAHTRANMLTPVAESPFEKSHKQSDSFKCHKSSMRFEKPQETSKQSAGFTHGRNGYEFGDVIRGWICRALQNLHGWFVISLMGRVRKSYASSMNGASRVPADMDIGIHSVVGTRAMVPRDIVARMVISRMTAKRLLEQNLPLLELILQELQAQNVLDAQDKYDLYNICAGNVLLQDPLQNYRKCLENVRSHWDIVFNDVCARGAQNGISPGILRAT